MAVRIRLKKMGRRHRPFFRVCAMDSHRPRDGKVIEELGYYDPMVKETDARVVLKGERIEYWLSVGALPTENVKTLIKKYGTNGTHLNEQKLALERLKIRPEAPPPLPVPKPKKEVAEEAEPVKAAEATEASTATEAAAAPEPTDAPVATDATETPAAPEAPAATEAAESAGPADDASPDTAGDKPTTE